MANIDMWRPLSRPFREMSRWESAVEKMFKNFPEITKRPDLGLLSFTPKCQVSEDDDQYLLKFDLPGVPKDSVNIELLDHQLTVTAERREEKKKDHKKVHLEEFAYGSYSRSFTLPRTADQEHIDAKFEDGVLTVTVPKVEAEKGRKIDVH